MKNKILSIIIAITTLSASSGCSDWLDVNQDPNALTEIPDPIVLLPTAQVTVAHNLMGWDCGFAGAYWTQYWTQHYTASQFKSLCLYETTSFSTSYTSLTSGALIDLKKIATLTKDNQDQLGLYFIAEVMSIFTWQTLTDLWGEIPYFEALRGNDGLLHPHFDKGDVIYADLKSRIDAVLELDLSNTSITARYDFYYGGNMDQWKAFANSLKLKLMIRLSETPVYDNAEVVKFIEENTLLTSSAKIDGSRWKDEEGKRHPMLEYQLGSANYISQNVIGCKSFIDYLKINSDPRLDVLFKAPSTAGHKGAFFGDYESKADSDGDGTTDNKESYSTAVFVLNTDLMVMTDWEVAFYVAEVYARANEMEKAQDYYEKGVKASLTQHGISDTEIVDFGYAKWVGGTTEECIKQIAMQKWVANCNYQQIGRAHV